MLCCVSLCCVGVLWCGVLCCGEVCCVVLWCDVPAAHSDNTTGFFKSIFNKIKRFRFG